jgi:hypothetical protein
LRNLLLDLLQLSEDVSEGGNRCGRRMLDWGWSGWTTTKSKSEADLSRTSWVGVCGRLQWCIALVNLLMKVVEDIAAYGTKADPEWTELIYSSSGQLSLGTWLTRHLISTKTIGLTGASNICG